jgi:hypothetical protein
MSDSSKKEKRGVFGFGAHGHHHHNYEHFDDYAPPYHHHHQHHHPVGPPPIAPPPLPPVNLGAHAHTTVVKKVAIPVHVPYPVKVIMVKSGDYIKRKVHLHNHGQLSLNSYINAAEIITLHQCNQSDKIMQRMLQWLISPKKLSSKNKRIEN